MKGFVILGVLLFAGVSLALPVDISEGAVHRWAMVPDGDGNLHLVDFNPLDPEIQPFLGQGDVTFRLFTRNNRNTGQVIGRTAASLANSNWINGAPCRFIVHGWTQSHSSPMNAAIRNAYLDAANVNVVVVDWSPANSANYLSSRNQVANCGTHTGSYMGWLQSQGRLNFATTHIVGHSLGGHCAGNAGKNANSRNQRIQSCIATDPAGPMFFMTSNDRFATGDCTYTEMIATDAGGLGFDQPLGHANFYPNWGVNQAGCNSGSCSHGRSNDLFAASLSHSRLSHRRCASFAQIQNRNCPTGQGTNGVLGGNANKSLSGIFTMTTTGSHPFA